MRRALRVNLVYLLLPLVMIVLCILCILKIYFKKTMLHWTYALRDVRFTGPTLHVGNASFFYLHYPALTIYTYSLYSILFAITTGYNYCIMRTVYLKKKRFTKPTLHATYVSQGYASDICTILPCIYKLILFNLFYLLLPLGMIVLCVLCI